VTLLCQVLAVPRSGYYAWRQRGESPRAIENKPLLERIRSIYTRSKKRYGSPRIHDALQNQGVRLGRDRVARLMQQAGLRARKAVGWAMNPRMKECGFNF
jgi:putative transposase